MDRNLHFNPGAVTVLGYSLYVEGGTVAVSVEDAEWSASGKAYGVTATSETGVARVVAQVNLGPTTAALTPGATVTVVVLWVCSQAGLSME